MKLLQPAPKFQHLPLLINLLNSVIIHKKTIILPNKKRGFNINVKASFV